MSLLMSVTKVLVGASLPLLCCAHGRLALPVPRVGAGVYENDPVASQTSEDFVCRHPERNPAIAAPQVTAGQKLDLQWDLSAAHVGDCAVFISYDADKPRRAQQYVKIANLPDCKSQNSQVVQIDIPAELPAGSAILRWDWKALHVFPKIEWYVQCADVVVVSTSTKRPADLNAFSIIAPPIYPASGQDGVGFRDPWGAGRSADQPGFFVTGPACVNGALNNCALTAPGTRGYTGMPITPECQTVAVEQGDTPASIVASLGGSVPWEDICAMNGLSDCASAPVGDELVIPPCVDYPFHRGTTVAPRPAPTPEVTLGPADPDSPTSAMPLRPETPTSAPTVGPSTPGSKPSPAPVPEPVPAASGAQCCYHGGCASMGTALCNAADSWCSESEERCTSCAGTFCPASSPRRQCVPSNEGLYRDETVWGPACQAAGAGAVCPEPMCRWAAGGLLELGRTTVEARQVRMHSFLGAALIQARSELGRLSVAAGKPPHEL